MPHRPLSMLVARRVADAQARGVRRVRAGHPGARRRRGGGRLRLPALLGRLLRLQPRPDRRRGAGAGPRGLAAWNAEQLDAAVASVEAAGVQGEWIESSFGHGRAYRYTGPARAPEELFWEVDRAVAPPGEESPYPGAPAARAVARHRRAHPRPRHRDGARRPGRDGLARATCSDFADHGRRRGRPGRPVVLRPGELNNEKSHDFGFILDFEGKAGRLHHVAFWVETNHDLTQGAKFLIEHGHDIDFGPGQHGIGEQNYLYFRDPAGLRYELNSGGYRNYVPDWEPVDLALRGGARTTPTARRSACPRCTWRRSRLAWWVAATR